MRIITAITTTLISSSLFAAEIRGKAIVTDGDTIKIGGIEIRLHGSDAPEGGQFCLDKDGKKWLCGSKSSLALADFIGQKIVACTPNGKDRYKRIIAKCFVDGADMQSFMVREGHALAFRTYSQDYVKDEEIAKSNKKGLWAGTFIAPWDYRKCTRDGGSISACSTDKEAKAVSLKDASGHTIKSGKECEGKIKGNVNSKGEQIYHTPSSLSYEKTRMDKGYGETWFCDEKSALAAGWRAPKR